MRYLTWLILSASLSSCAYAPWVKERVPDVPICRHLDEKITRKIVDGKEFVLKRPNPTCMYGDKKNKVAGIGEPRCGFCVWTVSEKKQLVGEEWNHLLKLGKKQKRWSTVQEEALTTPAESQAASKAFFINICEISQACSGDDITRVRVKFDALDSIGAGLGNRP